MANVAAHPEGSPMPSTRYCPSKGTCMPLPPMSILLVLSARRGTLKPSSEHVTSKKRASGQHRGSPMPPAQRYPLKGTQMPLPHATSVLPVRSTSSRLTKEPSSEHVALEKHANGQRRASPRGTHPCLPSDVAHRNAHRCPSRICNECPPRALNLVPLVSA